MTTRAVPHRRRRPVALLLAFAVTLATLAGVFITTNFANAGTVTTPTTPTATAHWSTVFREDFNGSAGSALNTANWLYDTGTSYPGGAAMWGTGEIETTSTSTSNVHLDGQGHLVIQANRDAAGNWTSGRVETQRTDFAAPAGGELEIAASIKQPRPANGLGYWPAFWALGANARPAAASNWPSIGELDVMESVNGLSRVASTMHCGTDPGGPCNETTGIGSGLLACAGCRTGYHTYSVIVDRTNTSAEQVRFYLDGKQTFAINESQVGVSTWQTAIDHGFYGILNLAIGGAFPNKVCNCTSPNSATTSGASMSVDWFTVSQKQP